MPANFFETDRTIANPASLGLFSFASTTLILSLHNLHTCGVQVPNVILGMAVFVGGLAQILAGIWEFPRGNTFGATAFTSYGAFWMSYAAILTPGSGIIAAYRESLDELNAALGIYLLIWGVITIMFFICSLHKNKVFIAMFASLTMTYVFLSVGQFRSSEGLVKAGGGLGVLTAVIALYAGLSELLRAERVFSLPMGGMASAPGAQ